jgi:ribosomal protein S19E (S16A)
MSGKRLYQPSPQQDWALHELSCNRQPSEAVNTRTLRSLERAGLVEQDDKGWRLTRAGYRAATGATARIERRSA